MTDLTPDEVRARAIIDDYIHTVTGMTPADRAWKSVRYDIELIGKALSAFGEAAIRALDPMQAFIDDFERKENR